VLFLVAVRSFDLYQIHNHLHPNFLGLLYWLVTPYDNYLMMNITS